MKYFKYYDLLNNKEVEIIKVELKPRARMTEAEWFNHMISGIVISSSDNLVELCDRIVIKPTKRGDKYKVMLKRKFYGYRQAFIRKNWQYIYGAVWSNGGLKYIAKMNAEGEMELL